MSQAVDTDEKITKLKKDLYKIGFYQTSKQPSSVITSNIPSMQNRSVAPSNKRTETTKLTKRSHFINNCFVVRIFIFSFKKIPSPSKLCGKRKLSKWQYFFSQKFINLGTDIYLCRNKALKKLLHQKKINLDLEVSGAPRTREKIRMQYFLSKIIGIVNA